MKKYTRSEKIEIARQMIAEGRREEAGEFCKKSQIAANVFEKLCREEDDDESLVMVSMPLKVWKKYEAYKNKCKDI